MKKCFNNPNFSLTKFVLAIAFTIVVPALIAYVMNTKVSGVWRAGSDLSWLWILGEVVLAVLAIGWITEIETASKRPKFIAGASAVFTVVVAVTVALNWKSVSEAFSGKGSGISLGILAYVGLMVIIASYFGRDKPKEQNNTPEGGAS